MVSKKRLLSPDLFRQKKVHRRESRDTIWEHWEDLYAERTWCRPDRADALLLYYLHSRQRHAPGIMLSLWEWVGERDKKRDLLLSLAPENGVTCPLSFLPIFCIQLGSFIPCHKGQNIKVWELTPFLERLPFVRRVSRVLGVAITSGFTRKQENGVVQSRWDLYSTQSLLIC